MRVNSAMNVIIRLRFAIVFAIGAMIVIITATAFKGRSDADVFEKRIELIVREVGHQLLFMSGDFRSRVMPVKQTQPGVFRLEFENKFGFQPDTLVNVVKRSLAKASVPLDYMVNVYTCSKSEMVYGFEIQQSQNNPVACLGRTLPMDCYTVEITFLGWNKPSVTNQTLWIVSGCLLMMGVVLFITFKKQDGKSKKDALDPVPSAISIELALPRIGNYYLDVQNQTLRFNERMISLTDKESKVLSLLYQNINQLTDREYLMQEVWVNEGVITGRSLDMFISKLRKKLSEDPTVRITNIHGKGYKLEVVAAE